jgi:hypothetical protein
VRCALLMTLLLLSGCYYPPVYYYPNGYFPYGYYGSGASYQPPHAAHQPYPSDEPYYGGSAVQPAAPDPNNCGTPDEPHPCYQR